MMSDLSYEAKYSEPCQIKECDQLGEYPTVRALINALKDKLIKEKEEHLDWESTKTLEKSINTFEEEYKGIAGVIDAYQRNYESLKAKLKSHEDFYKKIESMTNDPGEPQEGLRKAIENLKMTYYDAKDNSLYGKYNSAWNSFYSIQCKTCVEQAKVKVSTQPEETTPAKKTPAKEELPDPIMALITDKKIKGFQENFFYYKDFQNKVLIWFSDLDNLQKQINQLQDKNFRQRYAYRLEFLDILNEARILTCPDGKKRSVANAEWLKNKLTESFKCWVYEVYKYFYWQKNCLDKEDHLKKSWARYEAFRKIRREQFLSEAEEVPPELPTKTGECD